MSIGGGSLWALNNAGSEKERGLGIYQVPVSPESQAYWNAQTGYFPVTVAAQEEETFKQENVAEYPQFQTAIDQLHDSKPEYAGALLSVFPEARQSWNQIESLLNGNEDVDPVKNMIESINGAIEEYNLVNE